jgi:preprotein translocase subunit SecY
VFAAFDSFRAGTLTVLHVVALLALAVVVIGAVIFMTQGVRKIPVQYAKRIVGDGCTGVPTRTSRCASTPRA